ncbi:MAG: von Willebrand factor type A domain-containing protein, partial [Vicinamibacteria bacterium]
RAPTGFLADRVGESPTIDGRDSSVRNRATRGKERGKEKDRREDERQTPRDMYFEGKGTNPFIVTEEDPQATFGLDVDTASYTLTRNYLNRGTLPPPAAVRVEEFVNSFPNNVSAERGRDGESVFAVRVDGAPNPLHPGYHVIRVALKAKDVDPRERKAAHLTFVIDVSGSMAAENRLGLVTRSLALLVDKLDERDTIGIVVYGGTGRRVLAPTSVGNRDRILSVINSLRTEGSTNLEAGLDLGYEMAMQSFQRGTSNRVVLCTDGVANTGQTEADALLSRIRNGAKRGIDMMALGFGMGNYNDALLQRLADEGNGQYAYIDDLGEARAFFLRKLTSVLEVVARDAKAQVEFNPARVERYRLLGYEKRDVADRDFRNDAVDAGEINSGHSVTALFEVKLKPGSGKIGTARIRYKASPRSEGIEFARPIEDEAMARTFDQGSPAFRTAFVASRFAEHLRKSYWVKDESLTAVLNLAEELPETTQTNELTDLIRKATRLIKPQIREDW